jgi:hypothetical protein
MSPTLTIQFAAAGDGRQVTVDADCVLSAVLNGGGSTVGLVISRDPSTTIANAITSPVAGIDENIIAILRGPLWVQLKVPLSRGQGIFVSTSAAVSAVLYFEVGS